MTAIDLFAAADLYDRTERLMLADHVEEGDRLADSALLRGEDVLFRCDGKILSATSMVTEVSAKIRRLGLHTSTHAYLDADLPLAWIRIDGGGRAIGPAWMILDAIKNIEEDGDTFEDLWQALEGFEDRAAHGDYTLYADLRMGAVSEGGEFRVCAAASNNGWRWHYYPNDRDWLAGHSELSWSGAYGSETDALAAAGQDNDRPMDE